MKLRRGFTLLEVLLATAIGVLLMAGLYVAVEIQLRSTQAARDLTERGQLARALLTRMTSDITLSLAPPLPLGGNSSSAVSQPPTPGDGGSGGQGIASTAAPASGSGTSVAATSGSTVLVNLGVQGDRNVLMLTVSRVPRMPVPDLNGNVPVGSDLHRIGYWVVGADTSLPLGLARLEVRGVTSDEAALFTPPDIPDAPQYVVAEEVKVVEFNYFDGTTWQEAWDSTAAGPDGVTPTGPPLAIAIRIGIVAPGTENRPDADLTLRYYRHVVAIPTANGATQAATTSTTGAGP